MATYKKGKKTQLSNDFDSTEFDCSGKNCCSSTEIDPKLVNYLQKIRDYFGKTVTVTSGFRCETYNEKIDGAPKSKHKYGQAADIKVSGIAPLKVAQYAEFIGIKGIGQYPNFVHVDTREQKFFWYGSGQASRATFGGQNLFDDEAPPANDEPSIEVGDKNKITITGKTINVRTGPGTKYKSVGILRKGQTFSIPDMEGWQPIVLDNEVRWVSEKYIEKSI